MSDERMRQSVKGVKGFVRVDPLLRFWDKVERGDDCWMWVGGTTGRGTMKYGGFYLDGKALHAHRFSYTIHRGEIPEGLFVLHTCDVPLCVNPDHLFLGTHADNVKDKVNKGRQAKGTNNGKAKLTNDDVRAIRTSYAAGATQDTLAQDHGVARTTISAVICEKTWGHVT